MKKIFAFVVLLVALAVPSLAADGTVSITVKAPGDFTTPITGTIVDKNGKTAATLNLTSAKKYQQTLKLPEGSYNANVDALPDGYKLVQSGLSLGVGRFDVTAYGVELSWSVLQPSADVLADLRKLCKGQEEAIVKVIAYGDAETYLPKEIYLEDENSTEEQYAKMSDFDKVLWYDFRYISNMYLTHENTASVRADRKKFVSSVGFASVMRLMPEIQNNEAIADEMEKVAGYLWDQYNLLGVSENLFADPASFTASPTPAPETDNAKKDKDKKADKESAKASTAPKTSAAPADGGETEDSGFGAFVKRKWLTLVLVVIALVGLGVFALKKRKGV